MLKLMLAEFVTRKTSLRRANSSMQPMETGLSILACDIFWVCRALLWIVSMSTSNPPNSRAFNPLPRQRQILPLFLSLISSEPAATWVTSQVRGRSFSFTQAWVNSFIGLPIQTEPLSERRNGTINTDPSLWRPSSITHSILGLSLAPILDQAFGSEPIFETMPAGYQVLHPRSRFSAPGTAMARSRRALSSVVPISLFVRIPISIVFYVFFSLFAGSHTCMCAS
jgi:hypothetical protein